MARRKKLFVLERSNGWYGGYELTREGNYVQVFNTKEGLLFFTIKCFTDKGYFLVLLNKEKEAEFMEGREIL